jgi:hypothetical protein
MDETDTVPQLEALLLMWKSRPQDWSSEDLTIALYVSLDAAQDILQYLAQRRMIVEVAGNTGRYAFLSESKDREKLVESLDRAYRRELMRVSTMIHSKAGRAMPDLTQAFRFTKE